MKLRDKLLLLTTILLAADLLFAQSDAGSAAAVNDTEKKITNEQGFWLGYYTKFRLGRRLFYYGEYHMRRKGFMDEIDKVYLRFGATYFLTKELEFTAGIASPINFSSEALTDDAYDRAVLEFRFWEQALFVVPVLRSKTYHQIRFEQRWKRKNKKGAPYVNNYRWRYKFTIYVPLNNHHLQPGTIFYSFYDEIFMQSGEGITYNYFEDNRMFNGLGYIFNRSVQVQAGYLWNFHHNGSPYQFENQHIFRIAIYHTLDFYSKRIAR